MTDTNYVTCIKNYYEQTILVCKKIWYETIWQGLLMFIDVYLSRFIKNSCSL